MKSKKGLIIGIVSVVVVALAVVLAIVFWPKGADKKETYTNAIKNSLNFRRVTDNFDVSKGTEDLEKLLEEHIIKVVFEGSTDGPESENGTVEAYLEKDHFYILIDAISKGEQVNLSSLIQDNKMYIYEKNILSRWYYVDLKEAMDNSNGSFNIEAYAKYAKYVEKAEQYLFDALADQINSKNLVDEKADLTINGKKYSTTKYSYAFTGTDLSEVIKAFIGKIRNDKEITKELNDLLQSVDLKQDITLDEMFDVIVDQSASLKQLEKVFTYTIYLNNKDEVISTEVSIDTPMGAMILGFTLVEENGRSFGQISASGMGQKLFELTLNQVDDKNVDIRASVLGQEMVTGKITASDNNIKFKISGTKNFPEELDFEMNLNLVSELEMNGTITYNMGGYIGNYNIRVEEVDEFPQVDISNSAPYSEMTEEEKAGLRRFAEIFSNIQLPEV